MAHSPTASKISPPRLNDAPFINSARMVSIGLYSLQGMPYSSYGVLDHFEVEISGKLFSAVLFTEAIPEILMEPSIEPLLCFIPIPGQGSYYGMTIRPSIIYWRSKFWIPLFSTDPEREVIGKHIYGDQAIPRYGFDILHQTNVCDVPPIDILDIKTCDILPWAP